MVLTKRVAIYLFIFVFSTDLFFPVEAAWYFLLGVLMLLLFNKYPKNAIYGIIEILRDKKDDDNDKK